MLNASIHESYCQRDILRVKGYPLSRIVPNTDIHMIPGPQLALAHHIVGSQRSMLPATHRTPRSCMENHSRIALEPALALPL